MHNDKLLVFSLSTFTFNSLRNAVKYSASHSFYHFLKSFNKFNNRQVLTQTSQFILQFNCYAFQKVYTKCAYSKLIVFNRLLKVDNRGQQQISESTELVNEGYRLDLTSELNTYSNTKSYTTTQGHAVS